MAIRYINVGSTPNDNTGTTIRAGGQLLNNNFAVMLDALSTDGTTLSINTASTPSNTYLTSTFTSNTYVIANYHSNTDLYATFAQNTATITLVNDRLQVANAAATYATITTVNDRMQVANVNSLVNDRVQVANASPFASLAFTSNPNYGAAVTYYVTANGSAGYIVNNMGFDTNGNNPVLTVRNESTVAFALNAAGHPFNIKSGIANSNFSNTLIHVATDGTVTTGASAQGKETGVLYWQIPHNISSAAGNNHQYYCSNHPGAMEGNVFVKDTGAI